MLRRELRKGNCRVHTYENSEVIQKFATQERRVHKWENKIRHLADELLLGDHADEVIERAKKNSLPDASTAILYEKARMYLMRMI